MVAVKVADKDVVYLLRAEIVPPELVLTHLAAVNEELMMMKCEVL